jgi:SAM-dependent methyltransferase
MTEGIARLIRTADRLRLGSFAERFVELPLDAEWLNEVAALTQARHGVLRTYAQRLARLYLSDFDANALTGMYRMQLLPSGGWRRLLGGRPGGRLLDVGAGSGDITAVLGECFDEIETTEVSRGMAKRLTRRGLRCHELDLTSARLDVPAFDAVSLLNVLDRCQRPRTLLEHCLNALKPGGLFIVALALPYRPFYFSGAATPEPLERLECEVVASAGPSSNAGTDDERSPAREQSWEDGVRRFLERDLLPRGLALERLARVPYLSAGDSARELYELDDAVAVLTKAENIGQLASSPAKD